MEFRVGVGEWRVRSRRWSEGPSEGIRRIRRGLPEEEPSDTADDIQDLRLAVERRFERADTAYSPSGRSWREELELENGWQIPLLFLLYFVAKNKNQPQRTVDDRSERFGGFWGEAFGHRRL